MRRGPATRRPTGSPVTTSMRRAKAATTRSSQHTDTHHPRATSGHRHPPSPARAGWVSVTGLFLCSLAIEAETGQNTREAIHTRGRIEWLRKRNKNADRTDITAGRATACNRVRSSRVVVVHSTCVVNAQISELRNSPTGKLCAIWKTA
jgi:hypothetical protein